MFENPTHRDLEDNEFIAERPKVDAPAIRGLVPNSDQEPKDVSEAITPIVSYSSEEIGFSNMKEALSVACSAFTKRVDQIPLKITYRLYALGIRTLPEKLFGTWGLSTMRSYQLWRDDSGEPVAVTGLWTLGRTPKAVWLGWLGVKPSAQGRGVGTSIVPLIEVSAREHGYESVMLYHTADNEKLGRLYERLGFQFVENSNAWGEEVTVRKKDL